MSNQSNFPIISELLNFHSATITNGGQKSNGGGWVSATYVDVEVPLTGEWYWEYITDNYVYAFMGIGRLQFGSPHHHNTDFAFVQAGEYRYNGSNQANTINIGTGDIVGVYVNNGITKVYVNNSLDHTYTQNLSAVGERVFPVVFGSSNTTINFGQDSSFLNVKTSGSANATDANGVGDFYYTPPGNALSLASANTPTSSDIDPAQTDNNIPTKQFGVATYTGNGGTQSINIGFQPDLLWFKNRGTSNSWVLFDSTRGTTKTIGSDATNAESTGGYTNLDAFTSTGFDLDGGGTGDVNQSSANLVSFCWRANGGTTSTNNEGNHTCTLQANANAGFSIMKLANYTSASGVTIGHGLNKAPSFYIHKSLSSSGNWHVYHSSLGATKALLLNSYNAAATAIGYWNNTAPTADVLSLGNTFAGTSDGIVYAWAEVDGFSRFSSFEGNASTNGTYVDLGFRPKMIFIKDMDRGENWQTFDSERNTYNPVDKGLMWNANSAESTGSGSGFDVDFLSKGFKLRCTHDNVNGSSTYVYGAWGDVPGKYNNSF